VTYENAPSPFLGPLPEGYDMGTRRLAPDTAREIDCAVRQLTEAALRRATDILTQRRAVLEEGAARLLARETLNEDEILALVRPAAPAASPAA
jgi:cell division protease FtsH